MKYVIAHATTNVPYGERKFANPDDAEFAIQCLGLDDHVVQITMPEGSTP